MGSERDWQELSELFVEAGRNRLAVLNFAHRLRTRFGLDLFFSGDGLPHSIRRPVNTGTHPPYWAVYQWLEDAPRKKDVPMSVLNEGHALVSQGVRLRNRMLGLFPEIDRQWIFPLNVITIQGAGV